MANGRRNSEPRVPDDEGPAVYLSSPALEETLGNPANLLLGPDNISFSALLTSPATIPASVISYAVEGEDGLTKVEEVIRARAENLDTGKYSKYDSFYLPQSPIPYGLWEYKCNTCRFYEESRSRSRSGPKCDIVGQSGDPFGGENVHPSGWCAFWMPQEGRNWFEYAANRLEGTTD